jgi:hypothetical protein
MTQEGKTIDDFKGEIDAKKQHEVDLAMSKSREEVDRYKRRYDNLLDDYNLFKSQTTWLDSLSKSYETPIAIETESKTGTGEGVACAVCSDWHVYEIVKPERVSGLNTHSPEIAEISIKALFNGILAWTNIHRSGLKIKELLLLFLGDHVTNMLFEDQKTENAGLIQEEVLFALKLMCGGIDFLLDNGDFDKIKIVCCSGNHSRPKMQKDVANSAVNTYEWLMYKFMEDFIYPNEDRLEFQIANGYHEWVNIYGKDVRVHHGDWTNYQGGIGGLTIPMNKAIKAWNVGRTAALDILGHYHQTMSPGLFYGNGTTLGYSTFSVKCKGEYERPQQGLLIFDSKRFLTATEKIFVR